MKAKKTFNVNAFKNKCNWRLANCYLTEEALKETCLTLEDLLHETGNYAGFRYLNTFEVPDNELPGMRNIESTDRNDWFVNTNQYRRFYS